MNLCRFIPRLGRDDFHVVPNRFGDSLEGLKLQPILTLLSLTTLLLLTGCTTSPPPSPSPVAVAAKHLDAFTSGTMDAKQSWDLATAAINASNWDSALSILNQLKSQPNLSPAQLTAISDTISAVTSAQSCCTPK